MPDFLFGESGPFRGKTFEGWEEMRSEIVRYLEDRPRTKVTGIGSNINHLPGKIGEEKGKDDEEEGDWIWSVEVDDWICILRKGKGKGGKPKGKGKGKGENRECWKCGKTGHLSFDCWSGGRGKDGKGKGNGGKGKGDGGKGKGDGGKGKGDGGKGGKGKGKGYGKETR